MRYSILIIGLLIYVISLWHWDFKNTSTVIDDGIYKYSLYPQWLGTVLILFGDIFILNSFKNIDYKYNCFYWNYFINNIY